MLVMVGDRSGAIDIACQRYPEVVQLYPRIRRRRTRPANLTVIESTLEGPAAIDAAVKQLRQLGQAAGVVALGEAAVVPAAHLRAQLGIDGIAVTTACACTDKSLMKRQVAAAGIPTARFFPLPAATDAATLVDIVGLPLVLKRRVGSGGRDLQVYRQQSAMPERVEAGWLAESWIDGVEMSVESLVVDQVAVFTNLTQYLEPRWANVVPADPGNLPVKQILGLNESVIKALGIDRGMTHMELFVTGRGPVFSEIAVRPPGGFIMDLLRVAYDFEPWTAVFDIECGRQPQLPEAAVCVSGVRLFHPGPGMVASVSGQDRVSALPGLVRLQCSARAGMTIGARHGAGQAIGHVVFAGSRDTVLSGLRQARDWLQIEMQ